MARLLCSLCGTVKSAKPFDMNDPVFQAYVWVMRHFGISKHIGSLGVCDSCMPRYTRMMSGYRNKQAYLLTGGTVLAVLYFFLTQNAFLSLLLGAFIFSLSLLSYCPPLKE